MTELTKMLWRKDIVLSKMSKNPKQSHYSQLQKYQKDYEHCEGPRINKLLNFYKEIKEKNIQYLFGGCIINSSNIRAFDCFRLPLGGDLALSFDLDARLPRENQYFCAYLQSINLEEQRDMGNRCRQLGLEFKDLKYLAIDPKFIKQHGKILTPFFSDFEIPPEIFASVK